jgi:hypothetical protein
MKIKFKRKRLYINLILGIAWLTLGIFNLIGNFKLNWWDYLYVIAGVLYIGRFVYDFTNQYLIIKNDTIRKNILYGAGKQISLSEVKSIKSFGGEYILKTEQKELRINTDLIDKDSLTELKEILEKLNLPPENTPFIKTM